MKDAGYEYIVIDDGWEAMERDNAGSLIADPKNSIRNESFWVTISIQRIEIWYS